MKNSIVLLISFLAMQSQAAPADQWSQLVNKLETIKLQTDSAALTLARPLPSVEAKNTPWTCGHSDLDGGCDELKATIYPVIAYKADDVKKYHRDSEAALVKAHDGVQAALDLVLEASENPGFGDQERSALRTLCSTGPGSSSPLLLAPHEIYAKQVAGMSGSLDIGDRKIYKKLMDQTSNALDADRRTVEDIIARVKNIGGVAGPDGRYFTDLTALDNQDTVALVFRDLKGHEKEIAEMAANAGLLTRKTYISPTFNMRKAVYIRDQDALSPELQKQWFQDDEKIVAVSLGYGQGTARNVVARYTLDDFQWTYQGRKQPDNLKMEVAFLKPMAAAK